MSRVSWIPRKLKSCPQASISTSFRDVNTKPMKTTHGILSQTLNLGCIYLHLHTLENKATINIPYIKRLWVWHGIQEFLWLGVFFSRWSHPTETRNHFESFLEGPRSDSRFTRCSAGCQSGRSPRRWIGFVSLSWGGGYGYAQVGMDGWMVGCFWSGLWSEDVHGCLDHALIYRLYSNLFMISF